MVKMRHIDKNLLEIRCLSIIKVNYIAKQPMISLVEATSGLCQVLE